MWKIDLNVLDGNGPLLDGYGHVSAAVSSWIVDHGWFQPLRPFTILPSNVVERTKLRAKVFGPGYNLPTMSIDEYLTTEKERGNIITGGG